MALLGADVIREASVVFPAPGMPQSRHSTLGIDESV